MTKQNKILRQFTPQSDIIHRVNMTISAHVTLSNLTHVTLSEAKSLKFKK